MERPREHGNFVVPPEITHHYVVSTSLSDLDEAQEKLKVRDTHGKAWFLVELKSVGSHYQAVFEPALKPKLM